MYYSEEILLSTLEDCPCRIRNSAMENRNPKMVSLVCRKAFSLLETVTALAILALISSSVLVVINRSMTSMADSALRMQAFEVARENMEKLLVLTSAQEMVEYGNSEKNPDIQWQTAVETFYEPITDRMWVRAVCSAEYTDTADEVQTVELTHWLTSLTKTQVLKMLEQKKKEQLANQTFETIEEAAEYLGVDQETIQQWIDDGMHTMPDGSIPRRELDLYDKTDGKPTIEDRREQAESDMGFEEPMPEPGETKTETEPKADDLGLICGYTMAELNAMPFEQVWEILKNCPEF
jgi:type II secretory pathway component PulJ